MEKIVKLIHQQMYGHSEIYIMQVEKHVLI